MAIESQKGPSAAEGSPLPHEKTIPDIRWGLIDRQAMDPFRTDLFLDIECKRLGTKTAGGWILNENYVKRGILRFQLDSHRYGELVDRGAMIGYVQTMEFADILEDVNGTARGESVDELKLSEDGWQTGDISNLENCVERDFESRQITIVHFWIDLRGKCIKTENLAQGRIVSKRRRVAKQTAK